MDKQPTTLNPEGLQRLGQLEAEAVAAVTERFFSVPDSACARSGPRGREACREDLAFHLEFLRPVLEFGLLQPMVDYLCWVSSVLAARGMPREQLAQSLQWLAEFFDTRMEPGEASIVANALLAARAGFLAAGDNALAPHRSPAAWPQAAAFEAALLAGRQPAALALVDACMDQGHGLVDVELHVIQPALYRIGELWQANQVSVAQEHLASAIVESVMTVALLRSRPGAPTGRRVLLACVAGNSHAIGLRMVADAFQLGGWDVQSLGANVPTSALVRQVQEWKPGLVGLSVSFAQQLRVVKEVIVQLRERLGDARPAVIIGGLAVNRFPPLADAVGADLHSADARAAVRDARRVVAA